MHKSNEITKDFQKLFERWKTIELKIRSKNWEIKSIKFVYTSKDKVFVEEKKRFKFEEKEKIGSKKFQKVKFI